AQHMSTFLTAVQNLMPSFGWSVSFVFGFLEGEVLWRWGWKEYRDNQVFWWEQFEGNLMLIRLGFRVDFGARWSFLLIRSEALVYCQITRELKWSKSLELQKPGDGLLNMKSDAWVSAPAKVEVGISIILAHENFIAVKMALRTGFEPRFRHVG